MMYCEPAGVGKTEASTVAKDTRDCSERTFLMASADAGGGKG